MKENYYGFYDEDEERNIRINAKDNKNLIKINSTTMRISVLEDRTKSLEKMLRLFEERLNLKEEEKLTEIKNIESSTNIINKLNKKIKYLEKQLKDYITQKQITDEENNKKIKELTLRVKVLEGQVNTNQPINMEDMNDKELSTNSKDGPNIILNDFNEIIKNNNLQIDELIQEKIESVNVENESKINELLNLIHDINKIVEDNENKINLLNSNFNKFQKDNVNIIQMLSIQDEKINNVDYIIEEIKNLKLKLNDIASTLDDKNEEEKFTKEFLNSVRIK